MKHLNINYGLMGHVDSGKTTLAKLLSDHKSTAAFDLNPQSQKRGVTLDLGFSSFQLNEAHSPNISQPLQITLVDCPGHASLIKTVLGATQIIDGVLLVIDVSQGLQTQTLECLAICKIMATEKRSENKLPLLIIFNKMDLLGETELAKRTKKLKEILLKSLSAKVFGGISFATISASPGRDKFSAPANTAFLIKTKIAEVIRSPSRDSSRPMFVAFDHCFGVKGKGTVVTGTVLQGVIRLEDEVKVYGARRGKKSMKVKSLQSYGHSVDIARQGDRIGILVTNLETRNMERGYLYGANTEFVVAEGVVLKAKLINLTKRKTRWKSGKSINVNLGYNNLVAKPYFFKVGSAGDNSMRFDLNSIHQFLDEYERGCYVLLRFLNCVSFVESSTLICFDLDNNAATNHFRLLFYGNPEIVLEKSSLDVFDRLKLYKIKSRKGYVERIISETSVICKGMFAPEAKLSLFLGMEVCFENSTRLRGRIEKPFGNFSKTAKFVVSLRVADGKKSEGKFTKEFLGSEITLLFKKISFGCRKGVILQ